ncbi:LA2681 family HEPN domain-containing protein [Pseudomonas salomonii]|uniref:LA2681 family HEPN domain-containing protein n=1 Tax=Pseudomonas salomonii TaxID=191391 RepID=UPI001EEA7369|nr:LA2681 family HEPN domain-containing protein [Pseudomonas salomonii]
MQTLHARMASKNYQPIAEDRDAWLRVVEALVQTGENRDRLQNAFDCLVDSSSDAEDAALLRRATELANEIAALCEPAAACLVLYSCANAWAHLYALEQKEQQESQEDEESPVTIVNHPALLNELYFLHAAIQHEGFTAIKSDRRAKIHCNLGNALSACGRWIEALGEWRRALVEQPILGMALGNLGIGLTRYGGALYDPGHTYWFFVHARRHLESAIEGGIGRDGATTIEAITAFKWYQERLAREVEHDDDNELFEHSLGKSKAERAYRQWALENQLFLNPMNDLGALPVAGYDALGLPNHNADVGITYLAFFNQMKQEYAYARHCLFQGEHARSVHYADKEVTLAFNCDYALYSMGLEQIKTAFRSAYSLLDKVAFFINSYWKLEIPERGVSFRTLWFVPNKKGVPAREWTVRPEFSATKNSALRALYWLSQDIYSEKLRDVARPDAKALDHLRNHFEHKHAKIVDAFHWIAGSSERQPDQLAFVIKREDLAAKTHLIMRVCRAALVYLCLAMHYEESQTRSKDGALVVGLPVDEYPDDLKL